jgi:hypothetical protein
MGTEELGSNGGAGAAPIDPDEAPAVPLGHISHTMGTGMARPVLGPLSSSGGTSTFFPRLTTRDLVRMRAHGLIFQLGPEWTDDGGLV